MAIFNSYVKLPGVNVSQAGYPWFIAYYFFGMNLRRRIIQLLFGDKVTSLGFWLIAFFVSCYSYGHVSVISTYNPIYRMYNPIYSQF